MNAKTKAGFINTQRVLRQIWLEGPVSRVDLARVTGLDKSTITKITAQLISLDLIRPISEGRVGSRGGRRPVYLDFTAGKGVIAGIEMRADRFQFCYTDLKGEILRTESVVYDGGVDSGLRTAADALTREIDGAPLLGVGLGVPGIVDSRSGLVLESNPLTIGSPAPLADRLSESLELPVRIENDANCCAWGGLFSAPQLAGANFAALLGELQDGAPGTPTRLSAGLGFVIGGGIYQGSRFAAGEFRSLFAPPGPNQFRADPAGDIPGEELVRELCRNLALLINTMSFDALVVGGVLSDIAETLEPLLKQELEENWSYPPAPACPVYYLPGREAAVAYGAAAMFLQLLMRVPALADTGPGNDTFLAQQVFGLG